MPSLLRARSLFVRQQTLLLLGALLLSIPIGSTALHARRALPVHPQLLAVAAQQPDTRVAVIVQQQSADAALAAAVTAMGGTITHDLHIINAFAADMPARAVPALAQLPAVRWISPDARTQQAGTVGQFTTWAKSLGASAPSTLADSALAADSPFGANGTFAAGDLGQIAVAGFMAEATPGTKIGKVELLVVTYSPFKLGAGEDPVVRVTVGGVTSGGKNLSHDKIDNFVSAGAAGVVTLDITDRRTWKWSDFDNGLEISLDQSKVKVGHPIYYDTIGLRVTTATGTDTSGFKAPTNLPGAPVSTANLANVYNRVIRAPEAWNQGPKYPQGQGLTVAVVDSGFEKNKDIGDRLLGNANFNSAYHDSQDRYGHGSFVAGIVGNDGSESKGARIGIAPKTNVINVRVSDDQGMATEAEVVEALQWVNDNRVSLNIRVVNLSLNAAVAQSCDVDPLCAAVEILWFNKIVVVVSAGNNGDARLYPPANDPFVITVGATDDRGTLSLSDDVVAAYSAYGTTERGVAKPELVAPGTNIVGYLPGNDKLTVGRQHQLNRVNNNYFRMSGTSMSAPMVSGAVALLLQDEPSLTPDQVKYRLMATANRNTALWPGYDATRAGAGYLDIYAAVNGTTTASANTGLTESRLLMADGSQQQWNSANWGSANWGSANWGSANWGSANWGSDFWGN